MRVVLSALVLASPVLVAAAPLHTRGIPKNLLSVYTPASGKFTCLDKSATIDSSRVNDDYCDCADGSDEPGTSACPNTQFYCVNKGSKGKFVSSYVVNDGICDCCDGSDEYASRVQCADTCISDGAEWRKTLQQRIEAAEKGAAKREEYAAQSAEAAASRKSKVAVSSAQFEAAKTAREAAEKVVAAAEEDERKENEARKAAAGSGGTSLASALKIDVFTKEQLMDLLISHVKETKTQDALVSKLKADSGDDTIAWVDEVAAPEEYKSEAGNKARGALMEAKAAETRLQNELKNLQDEDAMDFGANGVFYQLKGKCYDLKVNQYTYQACPFGNAKQDSTSLGSFSAWDKLADGSNNYSQMQFSGGSTCWNGPSRSMKLLFECGDQDALLSVDEPEKCTYTARFSTPAVCEAETASKLRAELTDDLPVRDEL